MRRASDERADELARVYDDHVWDIYGFFGYRLASREEAEDLTQQTFERALRAWGRFNPQRSSARTWLFAIAHNLLIDHYRSGRSSKERPIGDGVGEIGEAELGADHAGKPDMGLSPELERALGTLSERDREIVALRFGGDLTGPEIAALTGLSLVNVQQILSRSLRRMHAELEGANAETPGRRG